MNCEKLREALFSFRDPNLPPDVRKAMEGHLETCAPCRKELEKQDKVVDSVRSFYRSFDPQPGRPFTFKFPEERSLPPGETGLGRFLAALFPAPRRLALAGAFLLLVVLGLPFIRSRYFSAMEPVVLSGKLAETATGILLAADSPVGRGVTLKALEPSVIRFSHRGTVSMEDGASFVSIPEGIDFEGIGRFEFEASGKGFRIRTPCAAVTVTGTDFSMISRPAFTFIRLRHGTLSCSSPAGETVLEAGFSCLIKADGKSFLTPTAVDSTPFSETAAEEMLREITKPLPEPRPDAASIAPDPTPVLPATESKPVFPATRNTPEGATRNTLQGASAPPPASEPVREMASPTGSQEVENPEQALEGE